MNGYRCTDCGRDMPVMGTCTACVLIAGTLLLLGELQEGAHNGMVQR